MLCYFLPYSKVIQLYMYVYQLFFRFFSIMVYPRIDRHLFELIVIVDLQCCVHFSCSFIKIVGKLSPLPRLILRE